MGGENGLKEGTVELVVEILPEQGIRTVEQVVEADLRMPKDNHDELDESVSCKKMKCLKTYYITGEQLAYILAQFSKASPSEGTECERCLKARVIVISDKYSLDHTSNNMATITMVEKRELEHSLNWLSTLGGAFSALGENDLSFAQRAGKVSRGQLLIAVRLGSPQAMSRCRLYASISLLQLGNLKAARTILLREYEYAKSLPPDSDPRLKRMCIGIWAKLKYEWKKQKKPIPAAHTHCTTGSGANGDDNILNTCQSCV